MNTKSPARDGRTVLPSLTGLGVFSNHQPSAEALGYFRKDIQFAAFVSAAFERIAERGRNFSVSPCASAWVV